MPVSFPKPFYHFDNTMAVTMQYYSIYKEKLMMGQLQSMPGETD